MKQAATLLFFLVLAASATAQVDPEAFKKRQQQMREQYERQWGQMRQQYDDARRKAEEEYEAFRHKIFLCPAYKRIFAHIKKRLKETI